ncbi:MAG TPA: outer membrane beta-barrel protein, partial [Caulobacteraceae bacterium]|nr:outer membrane beta-barrel protein [Caulobacteraceae bacterium]
MGDRLVLGTAAALAVMAAAALARAQEPPPAPVGEEESGVTSYPASYFAEFRPTTAFDMLGRIPGFTFDGGDSSIRGFAGAAGNVLIDGERPPSRGDSLSSVLGRIPAGNVVRIDIVRGGAAGIDMQGKTVVANVIRRKASGLTGSVLGTATVFDDSGIYYRNENQIQRRAGGRSLDASLTIEGQDLPLRARRIDTAPGGDLLLRGVTHGKGSPRTYTATGAVETPLAGGSLRLNFRAQRQQQHYHTDEVLIFPGGQTLDRFLDHQTSGEVGARYTRKLGSAWSLESVAFQRLFMDINSDRYTTPDFSSRSTTNKRTGESIVNAKLTRSLGPDWTLETGAETAYNFVDTDLGFFLDGQSLDLAGDVTQVDELRGEAFATATWKPRPKLSVEEGLRFEHSVITAEGTAGDARSAFSYPKPRLVISWTPTDAQEVQLRIERTVDQLSFDAFAATASFTTGTFGVGNSHIEPQKNWTLDARYAYRFAKQGSFSIEYTHQEIYDLVSSIVIFIPSIPGGAPAPFNVNVNLPHQSRDIIYLNGALPLDDLGFSGAILTVRQLWRRSDTTDPMTGLHRRIGGDRPFEWNASLTQNLMNGKISWTVSANGAARSRGFSGQQANYNSYD